MSCRAKPTPSTAGASTPTCGMRHCRRPRPPAVPAAPPASRCTRNQLDGVDWSNVELGPGLVLSTPGADRVEDRRQRQAADLQRVDRAEALRRHRRADPCPTPPPPAAEGM